MSATDMTGEEMFESLTGFEEIAVGNAFGMEVGNLAESKPTMFLRAMVFVHLKRTGQSDNDAKNTVMGMALKDCNGYFSEDNEVTPEEPVTPVGEGVSLPG